MALRRESSEECAFKLLPRLTSRGEGEPVMYDDNVLVQSALITSVFLHYDHNDLKTGTVHTVYTGYIKFLVMGNSYINLSISF